ncbi:GAF and ANTAR domain-containing protein [Rhodococcus sp. MEB041]|uniref:GAF and ANTAR domain-containing protein n=1 Tax=Rhodococcus sp. MEB041 TaxID=3040323 RepID=UPI00254D211C|nr:GAF and ANTAR domain-containing protein [Rhodococcus sp. MEB041]
MDVQDDRRIDLEHAGAGRVEDDSRSSLADLSRLATTTLSLPDMLSHVAEYAVRAIPGADGAGLTLLHPERAATIVASAAFVRDVDDIQYALGQGPCITAASEGRTVRSGELETDAQWPDFGRRVAVLNVHSALSLPLITDSGVLGAMNVYARRPDAFDDQAAELGQFFAIPAAISVQNARALASAKRLTEHLEKALGSSSSIEQAVGILISRSGCTPDEAYAQLRTLSQNDHVKMDVVARRVVTEASRSARARRRRR